MRLNHENFRALRLQANLRQDDLAAAMGIARTAISKVERGNRDLTVEEAARWAEICGASLEIVVPTHPQNGRHTISQDRLDLLSELSALIPALPDAHVETLKLLLAGWRAGSNL